MGWEQSLVNSNFSTSSDEKQCRYYVNFNDLMAKRKTNFLRSLALHAAACTLDRKITFFKGLQTCTAIKQWDSLNGLQQSIRFLTITGQPWGTRSARTNPTRYWIRLISLSLFAIDAVLVSVFVLLLVWKRLYFLRVGSCQIVLKIYKMFNFRWYILKSS